MREIKFRGQNSKTKEWVYGCLVNNMWTYSELSKFEKGTNVCEIITGLYESDNWVEAIEEESNVVNILPYTVGQFTGFKDKLGEEIYEGDITKDKYVIMWHEEKALFAEHFYSPFKNIWNLSSYPISSQGIEIIGNIHEHPELLK